jgi:YD repeat-containing protein
VDGINTHTCNCNPGYVSVNGVCVCDMNGTFALEMNLTTTWSGITFFENGTNVPSTSWAIRRQTYDATGNLTIQTTQCGGTSLDLCGQGNPVIVPDEAYGQFLPAPIFGLPTMPVQSLTITLANALPSQAYTEPQTAVVFGVSLTDPLGAWPAANANIGAGPNQTNGAIWVDHDNDTHPGVTSYAVPPGGVSSTTAPYPTRDYAATSSACPRRSSSLARLSYNYLPGVENLTLERVKRMYTAQRVISSMSGTITSCDSTGATLIQGTLGGPDNGQVQANVRVGGCVRVAAEADGGTGELDCDSTLTNEYDGQSQSQHVSGGTFVIKRVANTITCAQARTMTYP